MVFTLYDTYGFPPELTREMADEQGFAVDEAGFKAAMQQQRDRARASSKQKKSALAGDVYTELENEGGATRFTGYASAMGAGKVTAILTKEGRRDHVEGNVEFELVLDETPFYAERGGEVGDTGTIRDGGTTLEVLNTVPHGGVIVHHVRMTEGSVRVGDDVTAEADEARRQAIRRNHTGTHLLHEALGRVLGRHVRQAGSLVTDRFLRFDFTHHTPMTDGQIEEVERIVNEEILRNVPLSTAEHTLEEARELGAKALFDEKYGDVVRVVTVPDFSMELCGGLHVRATGDIGSFKVLREESIGSGTRRILAMTGMEVVELMQVLFGLRRRLMGILSADEEGLEAKARDLADELRTIQKRAQERARHEMTDNVDRFVERRRVGGAVLHVGRFPNVKPDVLRDVGDRVKAGPDPSVALLASVDENGACTLIVMADDRAVKLGANAGAIVREASAVLGGKGGGRPSTAQGGGRDGEKLDEALERAAEVLKGQRGHDGGSARARAGAGRGQCPRRRGHQRSHAPHRPGAGRLACGGPGRGLAAKVRGLPRTVRPDTGPGGDAHAHGRHEGAGGGEGGKTRRPPPRRPPGPGVRHVGRALHHRHSPSGDDRGRRLPQRPASAGGQDRRRPDPGELACAAGRPVTPRPVGCKIVARPRRAAAGLRVLRSEKISGRPRSTPHGRFYR